jgi:hypothetical protein
MYHHTFNYEHMLDVTYEDGKFLLKLDGFDPVEVPQEFGVDLGDLLYEIIESGNSKNIGPIIKLLDEYLSNEASQKCGCKRESSVPVLAKMLKDMLVNV